MGPGLVAISQMEAQEGLVLLRRNRSQRYSACCSGGGGPLGGWAEEAGADEQGPLGGTHVGGR